jgi:hypothetical protein
VGSTSFKSNLGSLPVEHSAHPRWVDEIRNFYQEFPGALRKRYYQHTSHPDHSALEAVLPLVWKTIGDEIVFCCRVNSPEHLVCLMTSFTEALDDYGRILEVRCPPLDVKGCGWLAAFPAPNVTVKVQTNSGVSDQPEHPDEATELAADKEPYKFDFLGKGIDCGFRLARFASTDKLSISAELALSLCEASNSNSKPFAGKFNYVGREELKGVINGRPYPVIAVVTERNALRREIFELERSAQGMGASTSPVALKNFLQKFMEDEHIESAIFVSDEEVLPPAQYPPSYAKFCESWEPIAMETQKREQSETASATEEPPPGDTQDQVPQDVDAALSALVKTLDAISSLREQAQKTK